MPSDFSISSFAEPPRLHVDLTPLGGRLRTEPEDFRVEEVPLYLPSGDGQHLYLHVEKRGRNTEDVVRWLRRLGFAEIGVAGRKDRQAVTTQWISVERRRWEPAMAASAPEGMRVLEAVPHGNKLKTGHLRGNRFRIRLRGATAEPELLAAWTARLQERGVPNYFGGQRFGREGDNAVEGLRVLRGERRLPRREAQFLLSALQSELFNRVAAERMARDLLFRVLAGDILKKRESGGLFECTDAAADQERYDRREVIPTGPLFGPEMKRPSGEPAALEAEVLAASGIAEADWARSRTATTGSRRALLLLPEDLTLAADADGVVASFFLPKGSFATVVLGELMGTPAAGAGDEEEGRE